MPLPDRLVFNKIRDLDPVVPNVTRLENTVRITNNNAAAIDLLSIAVDNSDFEIVSGGESGVLQPGQSRDVTVRFVYENPTGLRIRLREGMLTITTSDTTLPQQNIELSGIWQSDSENGDNAGSQEANLAEIVLALGYGIDVGPNTGQGDFNTGANTNGDRVRVGEEILSDAWRLADGAAQVEVVQLAAFHQQRDPQWDGTGQPRYFPNTTLYWYADSDPVGGENYNRLFRHELEDGQSLLPRIENGTSIAGGSFDPGDVAFGFAVDRAWHSDRARNEDRGGAANSHSHRWFAAKDQDGNLIPNTYLVAQDNVGTDFSNFDYQDNVYLVRGVRPVEGALAVDNAEATGSTGGIFLTWDPSTEGNVIGYHIERAATAGGPFARLTTSPVIDAQFNDIEAPVGTETFYRIIPVDYHGTEGGIATASATRPDTPGLPAQPTGLEATAIEFDRVTLVWVDNADNESGYRVQRRVGDAPFTNV
ncbi:MAG: hypothetical protein AAGK78_10245, partial [Planctomycetota bacterium]